ncbi:MAG: hypothetical protein V1722_01325 [Candidatus Micrarchaeota archaeon]
MAEKPRRPNEGAPIRLSARKLKLDNRPITPISRERLEEALRKPEVSPIRILPKMTDPRAVKSLSPVMRITAAPGKLSKEFLKIREKQR